MTQVQINSAIATHRAALEAGKISEVEYDIFFETLVRRLSNQAKKGA